MKSSHLKMLLDGEMSGTDLGSEISSEVIHYSKSLDLRGTSVPVVLTGDSSSIVVDLTRFVRLCSIYQSGSIGTKTFQYICDALDLSEASIDEAVRHVIEDLCSAFDLRENEFQSLVKDLTGRMLVDSKKYD